MDCMEYLRQRLAPRELVIDGVTWYYRPLNATQWIELQCVLAQAPHDAPSSVALFWRELLTRTLCDATGQPLGPSLVEAVPFEVAQRLVEAIWPQVAKN